MHESVQEWWIDHIHEPIDWVTYPKLAENAFGLSGDLFCTHPYSKLTLLEDGEGNIHLKNLSRHPVSNEEEGEPPLSHGTHTYSL